jgi:hypothetical protein
MGAGEVAGDPGHPAGAERLDPDLLERVEHRAGELALGVEPPVQLRVVMTQAQRGAVGLAPNPGHVLARHGAPRHWQGDARRLGGRRALALGLAGAKGDVERRPMRHRPAGRGDRALEDLEPLPAGRHAGPAQVSVTLAVLSGSSTPKHR